MHSVYSEVRKSGIPVTGDLPWGSHFCQFYQDGRDLIEVLVPFFAAGLENNEFCVWAVSSPLLIKDVKQALKKAVPRYEEYVRTGRIEIVPLSRLHRRALSPAETMVSLLDAGVARGLDGLRFVCRAVAEKGGKNFTCYGSDAVGRYNIIAAYGYQRNRFDALGVMEVVKRHRFALVRNSGRWEVIESSEARVVKDALERTEEKLQSLFSNMSEGFAYHRIVLDSEGKPCNYIFLEVNKAFEKLTGLKAADILGKRVTDVLPSIVKDSAAWIERYGRVALSGEPTHFESYSEALCKWFSVSAFSPHKGYFALTFSDITERRQAEDKIRRHNAVMDGINRIFREALTCETEEDLGRTCLAVAEKLTRSRFGFIGEIGPDGFLHDAAISGMSDLRSICKDEHRRASGDFAITGLCGRVLVDGKSLLTNDPSRHEDSVGLPSGHPPLRAFLGVPFIQAGKVIGMIAVGNGEGGYTGSDLETVEALAPAIVQAFARKRAEEELRRNREWLRVTLSSIGDAVIATDGSGMVTFLNPVAEKLTGRQLGEAAGQPIQNVFRIINELSREPAENIVKRVLSKGRTVNLANHTSLIALDGREIPIEDSAAPIKDREGNVIGVVLVFHDVTEKRRTEQALVESERHYRSLFENMLNGFAYCRMIFEGDVPKDFIYLEVNEAFETLTGLTNVAGSRVSEIVPGIQESDPQLLETYGRVARTGFPDRFETYIEALGQWFSVSVYSPRKDHFVAVFDVITERKKAELVLREAHRQVFSEKQRLEAVMEALPVGVALLDARGGQIKSNMAFEQIWGGPRPPVRSVADYSGYKAWWGDSAKPVQPEEWASARAVQKGETVVGQVMRIVRFDGGSGFIHNSASPVRDLNGDIVGSAVAVMDITEQKRMEEALRKAHDELEIRVRERTAELSATVARLELLNQELGEFAHVASHDLQEPLRKIQTFCDMARKRCERVIDSTSLDYLDRVLNSATRMRQLLRDLLAFSRVATTPEPFTEIDLAKAAREAVDVFEVSITDSGCLVEIEAMPVIEADESQILRLFQNLIGNSLKYRGDRNPRIRIYGKRDGAMCEICVEDNGIGFGPEFAELIFKPFQKLHRREEYEGTGMGLAICRKIVERHRGNIRAESEPGKGSKFIIRLPFRQIDFER